MAETPAEKKEREAREAAEAQKAAEAQAAEEAAQREQAEKDASEGERRYEVGYLVDNAVSLLDSRKPFVAAALAQSDRKTHTLDQAKKLLADLDKVRTEPYAGAPDA